MLVSDFLTTGPIEKASSEVVSMDTVKAYFDYGCKTLCGIPEITLLGEPSDWMRIRERVEGFEDFECEGWLKHLLPVLDRFVEVFKGNADPRFWEAFYKVGGGSGGPYVTGWVNVFYPYLKGYRGGLNRNLDWDKGLGRMGGGPVTDDIPTGLSTVPFTWEYHGGILQMSFLGGFVGAVQDGLAIRPAQGWGIAEG